MSPNQKSSYILGKLQHKSFKREKKELAYYEIFGDTFKKKMRYFPRNRTVSNFFKCEEEIRKIISQEHLRIIGLERED